MTDCAWKFPERAGLLMMKPKRFPNLTALWLLTIAGASGQALAGGPGEEVIVVYNSRLPESKQVADYYASRRQVPARQVLGLELPVSETMTRMEFLGQLQQPLLQRLVEDKLFVFGPATNHLPNAKP